MYKSSLEEIASKDGLDVLRVDIDAHKEFAGEAEYNQYLFHKFIIMENL
ncbi:hypothetical protein NW066_04345 [Mycoplasmopsis felis]|nr:hypothetical protein [Mycoplasmopsis felis]UWV84801.1 hypothetical protein NW066_04345 [Mycoplasmopsis felis]